jgi:hypothetical protein
MVSITTCNRGRPPQASDVDYELDDGGKSSVGARACSHILGPSRRTQEAGPRNYRH